MKTKKHYRVLFLLWLGKLLSRTYSRNFYKYDELPIFYWNEIQKTGNLGYLERSSTFRINVRKAGAMKGAALRLAWKEIQRRHVEQFGFPEVFLDLVRKEREWMSYKAEQIASGDKSLNSFLRACEREIQEIKELSSSPGGDFWKSVAHLNKAGFNIDTMRTSVPEFFSCFKIMEEQRKTANATEA